MEELLKPIFQLLGSRAQAIAGGVVLCLVVIPYLFRLWDTWLDTRSGKRLLECEKARLENLKLRYEIESIRKQYSLPEFQPSESDEIRMRNSQHIAKELVTRSIPAGQWRWLQWMAKRQPFIAKTILVLLLALTWYFLFSFALGAFMIPFMSLTEKGGSIWMGFGIGIGEAACAFGMFRLARVLAWQFRLLRPIPKPTKDLPEGADA
jgi:uncharacterized membrane protein (DUF485 family)